MNRLIPSCVHIYIRNLKVAATTVVAGFSLRYQYIFEYNLVLNMNISGVVFSLR